jgi:hypothetical protein
MKTNSELEKCTTLSSSSVVEKLQSNWTRN